MSRNKNSRESNGNGSYRKKIIKKSGKQYEYWEGRATVGYDDQGKQIQRSVTGKTKKEVQEKIKQIISDYEANSLVLNNKLSVGEWMEKWGGRHALTM